MPYTRVWVNNVPAGGNDARTADDEFRNLRADIEERMGTLVTGWTTGSATDPIVPKPEILGNVTGKIMYLHHSIFVGHSNNNESRSTQYTAPQAQNGNYDFFAPLILPVGVTLRTIVGLFDRQSQPIALEVAYTDAVTGAFTSFSSISDNATAGVFQKSLSSINHVIVSGRFYFIHATLGGQFGGGLASRLYGVFATFDVPDCRNTL